MRIVRRRKVEEVEEERVKEMKEEEKERERIPVERSWYF